MTGQGSHSLPGPEAGLQETVTVPTPDSDVLSAHEPEPPPAGKQTGARAWQSKAASGRSCPQVLGITHIWPAEHPWAQTELAMLKHTMETC